MHRLEAFDATAKGDNPMCGDRVQVFVKIGADGAIARDRLRGARLRDQRRLAPT